MFKYILIILCFASPLFAEVSNVYLGAPGQSTKYHNGYPIVREQYSMLYDTVFNQPLWAAWSLTKSDFGEYYYSESILADSTLPKSFYKVSYLTDYNKSGYVPGFVVPSAHRSISIEARENTRLLSQAFPLYQETKLYPWGDFMDSCTYFSKTLNKVVFVYCGPIYSSNTVRYIDTKLSQNKVAVPDSCYLIMAVMDSLIPLDQIKPKDIKVSSYVLFNFPKASLLRDYSRSVDQIEASAGLDFFSNLPTEVQSAIESPATGIIEEEDNELKIYPSPTAGIINIDGNINTPIEVYDINGQFRLCDNKSKIDLSDLPAGGYYLRVNNKMHLIVKI